MLGLTQTHWSLVYNLTQIREYVDPQVFSQVNSQGPIGFVMGLPRVTFCDTAPVPTKTAPLQVTGAHRTIYTHGIGGNCGYHSYHMGFY